MINILKYKGTRRAQTSVIHIPNYKGTQRDKGTRRLPPRPNALSCNVTERAKKGFFFDLSAKFHDNWPGVFGVNLDRQTNTQTNGNKNMTSLAEVTINSQREYTEACSFSVKHECKLALQSLRHIFVTSSVGHWW